MKCDITGAIIGQYNMLMKLKTLSIVKMNKFLNILSNSLYLYSLNKMFFIA